MQRCEVDRLEEEHGRVAFRDVLGCEGVEDRGGLLDPLDIERGGSRFLGNDWVLVVVSEDGHDGLRIT